MPSTKTLAETVKEARAALGMSQREVASAAGIGLTVLRDIEQGRRDDLLLSTARALGSVLGVSFIEKHADTQGAADGTKENDQARTASSARESAARA